MELFVVAQVRDESCGQWFESGTLRGECGSFCGPELRPGDGADETSGAEAAGAKDVFYEDANGARVFMKCVVEGDDAMWSEMGEEIIEVGFGAGVGVVSVDPEKADGT